MSNATDCATDPNYLHYQYADSEKLRIRIEAHERYSENRGDFLAWVLAQVDPQPGEVVVDVGCGPGTYHCLLAQHNVKLVGVDASFGMLQEARQQVQRDRLPVQLIQSDAQRLPLRTGCCDRLMANHMLYHVPDRLAALREMARVLRPGGRVVLTTNAADQNRRLDDLHAEAAQELGYTPIQGSMIRHFHLDHLDLVQQVFPNARRVVRQDAFRFPSAAAALPYYASAKVDAIENPPADGSHRPQLLSVMERKIERVVAREGHFRVSKDAGCFVAEKV